MVDHKRLIPWILANQDLLDLKVTYYEWITSAFSSMKDLGAKLKIDGVLYTGRGADRDEDTALSKAICEAVERFVCHTHHISSLGVAGHSEVKLATQNSQLEFIERYALWMQCHGHSLFTLTSSEVFSFENKTAGIDIYEAQTEHGITIALAIANGLTQDKPFGIVLGLGTHLKPSEAKKKALIECYRNLSAFFDTKFHSLSEKSFQELQNPTSLDQIRLNLDTDYAQKILNKLNLASNAQTLKLPPIITSQLFYNSDLLNNCPLVFCRTTLKENSSDFSLEFLA